MFTSKHERSSLMDVGIGSNVFLSFCRGIMNIPPLILILLSLFIAIHCLGACLLASTRKRKHQFKPLGVSFGVMLLC